MLNNGMSEFSPNSSHEMSATKQRFLGFVENHTRPVETDASLAKFYAAEAYSQYSVTNPVLKADTLRVSSAKYVELSGRTDVISLLRDDKVILRLIHHLGEGSFRDGVFDMQIGEEIYNLRTEDGVDNVLDTLESADREGHLELQL